MTAVATARPATFEALLATWEGLDIPEGFRAEISQGAIRLNPPPGGPHSHIASVIDEVLQRHTPSGIRVFQSVAIQIDDAEKLYQPDVVAAPLAHLRQNGSVLGHEALIVVEITSPSNADVHRHEKLAAYARGKVPVYLLVDQLRASHPATTLYSDPISGEYQHAVTVPFGESMRLPPPFNAELDTSLFPTNPA